MSEFSKTMRQIEADTKRIQKENQEWDREFKKVISTRSKAKQYEQNDKLDLAIKTYLENITYCQSSGRMNKINTFAHDIERVIILYGKTKQTENLIDFLKINIEKYKNFDNAENWKKRLEKLTKHEN